MEIHDLPVEQYQEINSKTPINMKENNSPFEGLTDDQIAAELQRRKTAKQDDRKAYKEAVEESFTELFYKLTALSSTLSNVKTDFFRDVTILLSLKKDAYGIKDGQQSHTFSDEKGNSITLGYRVTDGWDDTVNAGIAKINQVIGSLAKDPNSETLVKTLNRLLKKDAKGNLKASRVVEIKQMAEDFKSPLFDDGIDIIIGAYKPVKSSYFIEASTTDETGKKVHLPLSISSANFVQSANLDLSVFKSLTSE